MSKYMRAILRLNWLGVFAVALIAGRSEPALAVPTLQLYIEGATYVGGSEETWVLSTPSTSFKIWAIGDVGAIGTIFDVRLSAVYDSTLDPLTITLTPGTTGGFGGFTDPSTPSAPTLNQISNVGDTPLIIPGKSLSTHGQYGAGRTWQEFSLGNFTTADSPIGDFITSVPSPSGTSEAQINVYTVTVSKNVALHFDLYGYSIKQNGDDQQEFAPFSHDAAGVGKAPSDIPGIPEPGSMTLLALGSVGLGGFLRRKMKKETVEV